MTTIITTTTNQYHQATIKIQHTIIFDCQKMGSKKASKGRERTKHTHTLLHMYIKETNIKTNIEETNQKTMKFTLLRAFVRMLDVALTGGAQSFNRAEGRAVKLPHGQGIVIYDPILATMTTSLACNV
ncbi:unnamed protein product [Ceratitis capitata]|uniref:(Mediterranean fruit fly) hypothetical protein n=1 Tax=Ceratitis capitata TaxID=7213 RepID=A0A811UFG6_CERCA|nr:unnamed protein product [Ceratitis capitata]